MQRDITRFVVCVSLTFGAATSCKETECGPGTIERNGACAPADEIVSEAKCGPFTELQGDLCVPMFPPTICDPGTTAADIDPNTQVTTCIGTGTGGCDAPFACPVPADPNQQTICGQLFNFETGAKFSEPTPTGARCSTTTPTADGPCSLGITAYDAVMFAANPTTATALTSNGAPLDIYIDDCGRYRVPDFTVPSGPFVALGVDDAMPSLMGPPGTTNVVGVATAKAAGMATKDFDAYVAAKAVTDMWEASGGPPMSGGIFAMVYLAKQADPMAPIDRTLQANVVADRMGPLPTRDHYFAAGEIVRRTIDPAATQTNANGTTLITGAALIEGFNYSGVGGGISAMCLWAKVAGVSLPNLLFIQQIRPIDATPETCER